MNVQRLIDLALCDARLTLAEVQEVSMALRAWLLDGGRTTLHEALGMSSPARLRKAARNELLLRAADLIEGSAWDKARDLHEALSDFRRRRWPCWHEYPEAPAHASEIQALLWQAFRTSDGDVPLTAEALYGLISKGRDGAE
ncbi:hypothetical protein ACWA7J_21740 [Leptothrix sp. BB-4]